MIKIKQSIIPDVLLSAYRKGQLTVDEYLKNPESTIWPTFNIRGAGTPLYDAFNEKCTFCESKQTSVEPLYYEHFRPKGNAGERNGTISKEHYVWLMYQWDNLFLVCGTCGKNKANNFPTLRHRAPYFSFSLDQFEVEREALNEIEHPLIFDPIHYDPEDWFFYNTSGLIMEIPQKNEFASERGQYTIKTLDLNRPELVARRKEAIDALIQIMNELVRVFQLSATASDEYISTFHDIIKSNHEEFCGAKRFFIRQKIAASPDFASWIRKSNLIDVRTISEIKNLFKKYPFLNAVEAQNPKEVIVQSSRMDAIRINSVEIDRFRGIKNLTLSFPKSTRKSNLREDWLTLIGENGVGKSTVLQAIGGCLNGKYSPLVKEDFGESGYIKVSTNNHIFTVTLNPELKDLVWSGLVHTTPIIGYGSTRLDEDVISNNNIDLNTINGENLYNPLKPLISASKWIKDRITNDDFDKNTIKDTLLELVSRDNRFDLKLIGGEVHITNESGSITESLDNLSTGYKQMLTLACDIISRLSTNFNDIKSSRGIVLIDEIENHLHPKWKTEIVSKLRSLFPLVQFITTTHDPLCLNGLEPGEVVILRKNDDGEIESFNDLPSTSMLSSEQLLTSPFFDLDNTYSKEVQEEFIELQTLKLDVNLDALSKTRLSELEEKFKKSSLIGNNYQEAMVNEAIKVILERSKTDKLFDFEKVRSDVKTEAEQLIIKYYRNQND